MNSLRRLFIGYCVLALLGWAVPVCATDPPPGKISRAQLIDKRAEELLESDPDSALLLAREAEMVAIETHDRTERAWAVTNIGSAYFVMEQYRPALREYLRALKLHEDNKDLDGQSACLNDLGNLCFTHKQSGAALRYYQRSLQLYRQMGDSLGTATLYINVANVLSDQKRTAEALAFYQHARTLLHGTEEHDDEAKAITSIGTLYLKQNRPQEAIPYLEEGLAIQQKMGSVRGQATNLAALGNAYRELRNWSKAAAYYQQALRVGHEFGKIVRDTYKQLSRLQEEMGKYPEAYASYRHYTALNDSIFNRETANQLAELETRFRTREQRRQIEAQQLDIGRQNDLLTYIGGVTALVLLGATGLWWQYRQKQTANRRLAEANADIQQAMAEKEMLLQEIHHRVKNNLQLVSSLLSWQTDDPNTPTEVVRVITESRARIQAMALIHEHLYRAEDLAQVRLDHYLTELLTSLHSAHSSGALRVQLVTELVPIPISTKEAIPFGLLLNEVVTNAYKHAWKGRQSGTLYVRLTAPEAGAGPPSPKGANFVLQLCDDGVGVRPESFGADGLPMRPGSLGLQLVKMLTRQLKAKLTVAPRPEGGTCFEISRGVRSGE